MLLIVGVLNVGYGFFVELRVVAMLLLLLNMLGLCIIFWVFVEYIKSLYGLSGALKNVFGALYCLSGLIYQ